MDDKTYYGFPKIPFGKGKHEIKIGRIIRFLAGFAVLGCLLFGVVTPADKVELALWLGAAFLLIDRRLPKDLVGKMLKNGD